MAVSPSYKAYVLEQLTGPGPVSARAMFGGVGLYCQGLFFALIDNDTVYLKVDDVTRGDFERLGSGAFRPYGDESPTMQYYELPAEILEDRESARPWVARALEVARRAAARRAAGKRPR